MAIFINDFELILEAPPPPPAAATGQEAPAPGPGPEDIARMTEHLAARAARTEAD